MLCAWHSYKHFETFWFIYPFRNSLRLVLSSSPSFQRGKLRHRDTKLPAQGRIVSTGSWPWKSPSEPVFSCRVTRPHKQEGGIRLGRPRVPVTARMLQPSVGRTTRALGETPRGMTNGRGLPPGGTRAGTGVVSCFSLLTDLYSIIWNPFRRSVRGIFPRRL